MTDDNKMNVTDANSVTIIPTVSGKWDRVVELLGLLYERYSKGKVGPAHSGYDKVLDELMQVYNEWLD